MIPVVFIFLVSAPGAAVLADVLGADGRGRFGRGALHAFIWNVYAIRRTLSGMCITTRADIICLTLIVGEAKDRKEVARL